MEMANPLLESFGEPPRICVINSSRPLTDLKGKGNPDLPLVCSSYWPPIAHSQCPPHSRASLEKNLSLTWLHAQCLFYKHSQNEICLNICKPSIRNPRPKQSFWANTSPVDLRFKNTFHDFCQDKFLSVGDQIRKAKLKNWYAKESWGSFYQAFYAKTVQ